MFKRFIFALPLPVLAACNEQTPINPPQLQPQVQNAQPVQQPNQPNVVYQQAEQENHTIRDGLIGAGVGYMLGRHTAQGNSVGGGVSHPPVVHNTTVVKKVYVQQNVQQVVRQAPNRNAASSYRKQSYRKR